MIRCNLIARAGSLYPAYVSARENHTMNRLKGKVAIVTASTDGYVLWNHIIQNEQNYVIGTYLPTECLLLILNLSFNQSKVYYHNI